MDWVEFGNSNNVVRDKLLNIHSERVEHLNGEGVPAFAVHIMHAGEEWKHTAIPSINEIIDEFTLKPVVVECPVGWQDDKDTEGNVKIVGKPTVRDAGWTTTWRADGHIECLYSNIVFEYCHVQSIDVCAVRRSLTAVLRNYLGKVDDLELKAPYVLMMSLVKVKEAKLLFPDTLWKDKTPEWTDASFQKVEPSVAQPVIFGKDVDAEQIVDLALRSFWIELDEDPDKVRC